MNVVDSSGWLEYMAGGPNAGFFAPPVENVRRLVVPTICLYEVYRRVASQRGEDAALQAVALMHQGRLADLTPEVALAAARIGMERRLPMADSVILATARACGAVLWTQDGDFEGVEGVRFVARRG